MRNANGLDMRGFLFVIEELEVDRRSVGAENLLEGLLGSNTIDRFYDLHVYGKLGALLVDRHIPRNSKVVLGVVSGELYDALFSVIGCLGGDILRAFSHFARARIVFEHTKAPFIA